ncbi:HD-GYP domain-containing protein [Niveibacterium sp. 24ML]|uniref:HD-GYP domain-containing protein n=1 Tax=Niveibacterium sp. 24ML TaxID=2985512 RepID=UPI00226EBD3A|nr:HD-GYP domain-containing protein [Niveibacterium sp. 24ML]MCX9155288.1 HD-GYP domain-containing protein [Niveibacterium sp. 24ML]
MATSELELGMFVAELDRPWLETPFLIQGFMIENDQQLAQLRAVCRIVAIDRDLSEARHQHPLPRQVDAPVRRSPSAELPPMPLPQAPTDFFELLRFLKQQESDPGQPAVDGGPVLAWQAAQTALPPDLLADEPPASCNKPEQTGVWAWLRARARDALGQNGVEEAFVDEGEVQEEAPYPIRVPLEQELVAAAPVHREAVIAVKEILRDVERQVPPDLGRAREVVGDMMRSVVRHPDALLWLTRLKRTDRYTYDHALDCSTYMMVFARHLGLPEERIVLLGMAGLMLDIGKLRLSQRLLAKTGALTPLEYELFKTHVESAVLILRADANADPELIQIVARHHERFDGSGYPEGIQGEQIGVFGEMAGIVDSFCAMTRHRSWRPAVSAQRALETLISQRNKHFSEVLVDQYVQCIGIYPAGTLVELNSGEVAVVVAQNRVRRLQPRVMILLAPDHSANANPHTIDLLFDPLVPGGNEPYRIVRSLPEHAFGIDPAQFYLA